MNDKEDVNPMRYVETIEVDIDTPQDYPGNARLHDEDWLDASVQANGQYRAVLARRLPDGTLQLLAGHGTRAAFRRRGDAVIRVEVIEATDREARRINLVDNPRPGIGGFDDNAVLELLDLAKADGGLEGTGWDEAAYEDLLKLAGPPPSLDDLERRHGEPQEDDLWPKIVIAVPPEVKDQFDAVMRHPAFEAWVEEYERFAALLTKAEQGLNEG